MWWTRIAVAVGLFVAAAGVAALWADILADRQAVDRASRCREYRNALTLALDDPASTAPLVDLDRVDQVEVERARARFGSQDQGAPEEWRVWAERFRRRALARQDC